MQTTSPRATRTSFRDLRRPYDRKRAALITKLHAAMITAAEYQTHDYYMNIGPLFADPLARQLYAEIASIEEQHVTQYGSLEDPTETFLEKWLLHEAMEVYNYHSCVQQESNPRIKAIWERFLDYELGHLHLVGALMKKHERRDPAELLGETVPEPVHFTSQREFVRKVLAEEVQLRSIGTEYGEEDSAASLAYREHMHADGVPSEIVAAGYRYTPGTELNTAQSRRAA
jgi:hypothetical protein